MGMDMSIRILPGGDENWSKVVYSLGLRMRMEMNFYYGGGDEFLL